MNRLILAFLCLLPWSPFLMTKIDMWHAQGQFAQLGILALFCCSFFLSKSQVKVKNIPLGLLFLWVALWNIHIQYQLILVNKYNNGMMFLGFFNFLCLILFYQLCIQHLNRQNIDTILKWFSYSILLMVFYCVIQALRLDQFMRIDPSLPEKPIVTPPVVGMLGNPTHLSAFLGMCLPLFFKKKALHILSLILIWILLLFFLKFGTNTAAVPLSGIVIGIITTGYYILKTNRKLFIILLAFIVVAGCLVFFTTPVIKRLFADEGRIGYWTYYFNLGRDSLITGKGIGSINAYAKMGNIYKSVRHLHNEFFHFTFELGFIGLMAILYCIWDYFKIKVREDRTSLVLRTMFLGFLINCLFLFPAHLWLVSTLAMFCYAGMYAIKNEELNYGC